MRIIFKSKKNWTLFVSENIDELFTVCETTAGETGTAYIPTTVHNI